jgi:hypothetical protein
LKTGKFSPILDGEAIVAWRPGAIGGEVLPG